ncbi:MAG: hypothetical protein KF860_06875 [Cyclobacteriaceae bacterium]|nr:hypothetical protein [Cyclobacteriaceae bacterium]
MKTVVRLILITVTILFIACENKDEVSFTSLIGAWTYTTPDKKIKVEFDIVGGDTELLAIKNQKIFVEGKEGKAEVQTDAIAETTFGFIRINANDVDLVRPYDIKFTNLKASEDFSVIEVEEATYTFPWSKSNALTDIEIVRR